jgi:cell division protein FtsL
MSVIILLILQVVVSNRLATTGIKIAKIETDIEQLTQENADIKQQIASASALRTIQSKAKQLGFTQTVKPIYLDSAPKVAIGMQ